MADGAVIIGAGMAGLSAAFHMGKGCQLFEADDLPGGLMRTQTINGYSFDCTGHLLHLKDDYARRFVTGLLKGNLAEHTRKAGIYSKGVFTGYPFQANTYGLPADVARECLEGFMDAPGRDPGASKPGNFSDFITHYFGHGIAGHFMLPYNRKLWRYPLEGLAVEGIEPYVPVPTVDEIKKGATPPGAEGLGYNARFFYPVTGGIYTLAEAMTPFIRGLSLGQRAMEVDAGKKTVTFGTGYTAWYDRLISTIPLPELVGILKDVPERIREAAQGLRYVSVYDVSLGVEREGISPYHWIYFPEEEFPFYRVGFMSNFSASMAPEGCSSIYVEISHMPGERSGDGALIEKSIAGLKGCGFLRADDKVPVADVQDIKYAYVVPDEHSKRAVPLIMEYLRENGILSIGRYGAWEYSSMEDAILEGRAAARDLAATMK